MGGRTFEFRRKYKFPKRVTEEFLLVDLMNNLKSLAEDREALRVKVGARALEMDTKKLRRAVKQYANTASKKYFESVLSETDLANIA